MLNKKLQKEAANYGSMAVKAVSVQYIILSVIASQIAVLWLSSMGSLFPGEETFLQIIGTCAEIVAGLYGITLAGYTFFLSRIDALTATDTTLDYVVASIKNRFKYLIWYITITVTITLFISVVLMYYPVSSELIPEYFYRLICNEFVLVLGFSVILILYYSLSVVDPNCLEKEAERLKKKLSSRFGPDGSAAEFISLYDRIEGRCNEMLPQNVLQQLHENKGKRFEHTMELLYELRPQIRPVLSDLNRIYRYYACMVNCSPLSASEEMCILARKVLAYLEEIPSRGNS